MSFSDAPSDMDTMAPEGAPVELASAAGQRREKRDANNPLQPCSIKQLHECQFDAFTHRFTLKGKVEFMGMAHQFEEQPSNNTLSMEVDDGSGAILVTKVCDAVASESARIMSKFDEFKSTARATGAKQQPIFNYVRVIGKLVETRKNPFQPQTAHQISAFSIEPVEDHNAITWMITRVCRAYVEQETGITRAMWEQNKSGNVPNIPGSQQQQQLRQQAPQQQPQMQQQMQQLPQAALGNFAMRGGQQPPQAPAQQFAQGYAAPPQPHQQQQQYMQHGQQQQYVQSQPFAQPMQQQLVRPMTQMQMQPQVQAGFGGQQVYPQQGGYAQQQMAYPPKKEQPAGNAQELQMWQFFQQQALLPQCKEIGVNIHEVAIKFGVTAADADKFFLAQADGGQCYTTVDTNHYMPS